MREEVEAALREFPAGLRALVEAELAAGNEVTDIGHHFPAPPVGAFVKMREACRRPGEHADGVAYHAHPSSLYSGWWTDGGGRYFVVDPPGPAPSPDGPDMDAIRAAHADRSPEAAAARGAAPEAARWVLDIDYRGEMVTLRTPERVATVICTFGSRPVLYPRTLSSWWLPGERRTEAMPEEEKAAVIGAIIALAARQGVMGIELGD